MQQAEDFRAETRALAAILEPLDDAGFARATQFKGWRVEDVIGHLHMFNVAALKTLESDAEFAGFFAPIATGLGQGKTLLETQAPWLDGLAGQALFRAWRDTAGALADAFARTDPKRRLKWAGPDMSALSAITARQMETWAHGQEIFDALGLVRVESDRIRNIAHLGVATHGWSFAVRGHPMPDPAPHVRLMAPSGTIWEWNAPQDDNRVEGTAVDFARVVTQVRNVADTLLVATGDGARQWLAQAQCFAGPPEDPPVPGARHVATMSPSG
jgi:uncharacterized protein (TIGR03084 family)